MATTFATLITQVRRHILELPAIATPGTPTVTPQGTPGAVTYGYKIVAANRDQTSIASAQGSTGTGNTTLSSSNFNRITWTAVTYATYYIVYRTQGGATQGVVAIIAGTQLDDTGLTADGATAPTAATGGAFWTDAELLDLLANGAKDMWAAILDVFGDHFLTVDITNVTYDQNTTSLTGVPSDVFRVHLIEPRDTTNTGSTRGLFFLPRKYNHPDFIAARSISPVDPNIATMIYYDVSGAGAPAGSVTILTAPQVTSQVPLRFVYNPTLAAITLTSQTNPIPGESDMALIAYAIAYARAKERDDRSPDPNWIAVYATEKQSILTRITPRQDQEPDVVDGLFDDINWNY